MKTLKPQEYKRKDSCDFFPATINIISSQMFKELSLRNKPEARDTCLWRVSSSLHFPTSTTTGKLRANDGFKPIRCTTIMGHKLEEVRLSLLILKPILVLERKRGGFLDRSPICTTTNNYCEGDAKTCPNCSCLKLSWRKVSLWKKKSQLTVNEWIKQLQWLEMVINKHGMHDPSNICNYFSLRIRDMCAHGVLIVNKTFSS